MTAPATVRTTIDQMVTDTVCLESMTIWIM